MTQQTRHYGDGAIDFGLLSPCPVDAGWYERYWYGDNSPSRLSLLSATRQLCRQFPSSNWAWLASGRGAISSLKHSRATLVAGQACEAAGD